MIAFKHPILRCRSSLARLCGRALLIWNPPLRLPHLFLLQSWSRGPGAQQQTLLLQLKNANGFLGSNLVSSLVMGSPFFEKQIGRDYTAHAISDFQHGPDFSWQRGCSLGCGSSWCLWRRCAKQRTLLPQTKTRSIVRRVIELDCWSRGEFEIPCLIRHPAAQAGGVCIQKTDGLPRHYRLLFEPKTDGISFHHSGATSIHYDSLVPVVPHKAAAKVSKTRAL